LALFVSKFAGFLETILQHLPNKLRVLEWKNPGIFCWRERWQWLAMAGNNRQKARGVGRGELRSFFGLIRFDFGLILACGLDFWPDTV